MKKNYFEPEMEIVELETVGFLAASDVLEEPSMGGSEEGYGNPEEFDPS